jgi:hypothetical protein
MEQNINKAIQHVNKAPSKLNVSSLITMVRHLTVDDMYDFAHKFIDELGEDTRIDIGLVLLQETVKHCWICDNFIVTSETKEDAIYYISQSEEYRALFKYEEIDGKLYYDFRGSKHWSCSLCGYHDRWDNSCLHSEEELNDDVWYDMACKTLGHIRRMNHIVLY